MCCVCVPPAPLACAQALRAEIVSDAVLTPLRQAHAFWTPLEPTWTWLTAPWFLVENYMYKRVLEVCACRHR